MSAWTYCLQDGKAAQKIVPPRPRIPCWKGPGADSEEKHEPASDIDTVTADSLKALDPRRPIREADMAVALSLPYAEGYRRSDRVAGEQKRVTSRRAVLQRAK